MATSKRYQIASYLLSETQRPLAWSNLGYWENTDDYVIACEQLAARIGRAAKLDPNTRLLDLACGQGASIAFWRQHFGVSYMTALDIQANYIGRIKDYFVDQQRIDNNHLNLRVIEGSFDDALLPIGVDPAHADAVVCIDAAYHAKSMVAFLNFCSQALKPSGRLAFCTLVASEHWQHAATWQQKQHEWLLKAAGIAQSSLLTQSQLEACLTQHGFDQIQISLMDHEVLAGFSQYIQQRASLLSLTQKLSPSWQKIAMTARLCDFLYQHKLVHYGVISAVRRE